jgi:signal transduction histidine kinase
MSWKFFLPILILLSGWLKAGAQELPLTHFTSDSEVNALPSALVPQVYQDRQGFIWFTVFTSGLVRYDGSSMDLYDQSHGLRDLGVWQIVEDGGGRLWVSSGGGLVVSEKPLQEYQFGKKVKFTALYKGSLLSREAISSNQLLTVDTNGRIWAGSSDKGIIRYQIDREGVLRVDTIATNISGSKNLAVTSLKSSAKGVVYAGLEGGLLVEFFKDRPNIFYGKDKEVGNANVTAIYEDSNSGIWAYRQNGEILYFATKTTNPEKILGGLASNVTSLTALKEGTLLAGNGESGISRINMETRAVIKTYSRSNGLLSDNVFNTLEDKEGNVWIAQSGGVSKLRYNFNAFDNFTARSIAGEKPVLPSGKINTVLVSPSGKYPCKFWVGTEAGATCVNEYGTSKFITRADGLLGDWVNGLAMDENGRLWIATNKGLNAIVFEQSLLPAEAYNVREISIFGKEAYLFSIWDSPPFIASENISTKQDGRTFESVWFAGVNSLYVFANETLFELGPEQGLPSTLYKSIAIDNGGHVWVGTRDRGLYRSNFPLYLNELEKYSRSRETIFSQVWSLDKGAPTNDIEKLLSHNGVLWAGTQIGLFKIDPASLDILLHVNRNRGLPADNAVSFALSPLSGNLWVGTNKGLAEVDPADGEILKTVTRQDGLVENEVWLFGSVKIDRDGNVYYGTSKGLSIYHPEKDQPNRVPPTLALTSAEISYKSDSRNEVTFEYAALSYANVANVKYRTRLLGYDDVWSSPGTVKRLRYTNLPAYFVPREYTLEVMAENESGITTIAPLRYTFTVEPVGWLQWWAFVMYTLFFGTLIFIVDRIQRRRLIKREREHARLREAELQAETATARSNAAESQAQALRAENEKKAIELEKVRELEKAYNELKTTQKQLIQAEKMASLGRLATGVAHEIKNPLNFINNFAELSADLVEELEEARKKGDEEEIKFLMHDLKQNTRKIEEHGKRADAIVRSMMQHARGGKPIFELFDINELVEKYAELAYQGKRNQYPGFKSKIEKDLDPHLGEIRIVGQEVGQVLLNIIGNSLDAVLEKKKQSQENYEAVVRITTRKSGKFVEIVIEDNGPGIPEDIRERIFEPFFTTKPTGEGTGLGLSLSYNIITQGHNGSLSLVNNETRGATFVISLPILKGAQRKKVMAR